MHTKTDGADIRPYSRKVFRNKIPRKGNCRAYLAGFFDADGTVTAVKYTGQDNFYLVVALYNTDLEFLNWAQTICGGTVYDRPRKDNHKQIQRMLRLTNMDEQFDFLNQVYPHLRIKKKAVEFAIRHIILRRRIKHVSRNTPESTNCLRQLRAENQRRSFHVKPCNF